MNRSASNRPAFDQWRPVLAGAKSILPAVPGLMSFGMICGAATVAAGLSKTTAIAMTVLVYAGTLQLAAVQLATTGAPLAVIAIAGIIVNLRFALFSLSIAPYFKRLPARLRALFAYAMTDNSYAQAITHFTLHPEEPGKGGYYFGATFAVWITWIPSAVAGVFLGAALPHEWQLEFTVLLTLLALGVANVRDRASAIAAAAAGATAVLAAGLPYRMGLLLAAAAGVGAGLLADRWIRSRPGP